MGKNSKRDKIICVDLECTCWSNKEEQGDQSTEIIQIGICSLNLATKQIEQQHSYFIKPKFSTISNYCTALTGITTKTLKGAMPLSDACNSIIKKYGTRNRVWTSYGIGDKTRFREDCIKKVAEYPFGPHHIDASLWFHLKYLLHDNIGLSDALKMVELEFEGTQHDALWDAINTAKLLKHII